MDLSNVVANLNYWAILVAALSTLVLGSIWYSPFLFGKTWMRLNGFTEENLKGGLPMPVIFGTSFFVYLLAAISLAMFLGTSATLSFGIFAGVMIAVFWISTAKLNNVLFERQKFSLFLINAGYDLVCYIIMGAIIGGWQ
ncbi:DUF1761 domain-containing protein [Sunxiuqinia sp. A32]|uniref:DUF1761 domain-containing protein n=1 Tax=Sunxiuqinia sp. A32 TaxID=3461496 RepID=UPI00404631C4